MPERLGAARLLLLNLIVGVAYATLGVLALRIADVGVSAPFWPAAGVAFAFVYRWQEKVLPGVFLGSIAANTFALTVAGVGDWIPSLTAVLVASGSALQAVAGSRLVRRFVGDRSRLETPRDILLFLALSGPVAAVVAATVGTLTQVATGILTVTQAGSAWLVWWVGDAIGILVFGPLTLMLLPDLRQIWAGRRWKIAVPSLIISTLLVGVVVYNGSIERDQLQTEQGHYASGAVTTLQSLLGRQQEALEGIKGLQLSSSDVTADEFKTFTEPTLERYPSINALSWNAVVREGDLAAFEEDQRQQPGYGDYTVTERDEEGNLIPVGSRPEYVAVQYIEPIATNQAAVGFDIGSNPARLEAITAAIDTARPTATSPIDLVQETGSQKGVLVLTPTYQTATPPEDYLLRRSEVQGLAVGVYRMTDMIETVYADSRWDDVAIRVVDVTAGSEPTVLGERAAVSAPTIDLARGTLSPIPAEPIDVFGRTWSVEVTPMAGDLATGGGDTSRVMLIVALLGVFLFEALLILLTGLEQRARREATEKSYEATHDALTGVVNRRGFIEQLETLCQRAESDQATHVLLFADLDRFKQVNDLAGHEAGDDMLIEVAHAIRGNVRGADTVARIGGDEFAVILRDCPMVVGERTARDITASIDALRLPSRSGELSIGVSVGMTAFGYGGTLDKDEALRQADLAAYAAKASAGSSVEVAGAAPEQDQQPTLQ